IALGTALQLTMVIAGHSNKAIAGLFAVLGMTISLLAGLTYAMLARTGTPGSMAMGGLIAGAACAFLGIVVSVYLRDVPPLILLVGTASSALTGAFGGWAGRFLHRTV